MKPIESYKLHTLENLLMKWPRSKRIQVEVARLRRIQEKEEMAQLKRLRAEIAKGLVGLEKNSLVMIRNEVIYCQNRAKERGMEVAQ